jgi:heme A synthase
MIYGMPLNVHIAHRILAFLLFFHLLGIAIAAGKRGEPAVIKRIARLTFGAALLQVLIAAAMIEMHFPPVFRSLHQAFGTLVWLSVVTLTILSYRASRGTAARSTIREAA